MPIERLIALVIVEGLTAGVQWAAIQREMTATGRVSPATWSQIKAEVEAAEAAWNQG